MRLSPGVTRYAPSRLRIELGCSHQLAVALAVVHLLAGAGVLASRLPAAFCTAALVVLVSSLVVTLRRHAWLRSSQSLVRFELSEMLEIEAMDRSGRRLAGTVLGTSFVAPWLVVVNFKVEGRRFPCAAVVPPDATDDESFRALRVWLRWRRRETADR